MLRHRLDRRRHALRYALLAEILPALRQTRMEADRRQRQDFDAIGRYAAGHTDFYAARFAGALERAGRRRLVPADLPVLRKQDVRDHLDGMLVRDVDRRGVRLGHTGGSSGVPLAFYYDDAKHELMLAGMLRGFMLSGWRPGQRVLYLWGASRDLSEGGVFRTGGGSPLAVEKTIAATEFSEPRLAGWAATIRAWRPTLLYGYASALTELARYVVDQDLSMPTGLIGAYSTAEVLHDGQRELIGRAFGCRVYNQYGCREVPNIAWECRHGGMHVFSDLVHLESVHEAGEDRLLATSLTNRLMPFIRYDLGDTGRVGDGECGCGLPFPMLEMDLCRHNDLVRAPGGRRLHPAYFNRLLYGLTEIRQYQWVQRDWGRIDLNLVSDRRLTYARVREIEGLIRRDLGDRVTLQVNYLDAIPRGASGKHRFVIGLPDGG